MSIKEQAIKAISVLPDDSDLKTIIEEVELVVGVQEGLDQLDRGEGIPIETVREEIGGWTTK